MTRDGAIESGVSRKKQTHLKTPKTMEQSLKHNKCFKNLYQTRRNPVLSFQTIRQSGSAEFNRSILSVDIFRHLDCRRVSNLEHQEIRQYCFLNDGTMDLKKQKKSYQSTAEKANCDNAGGDDDCCDDEWKNFFDCIQIRPATDKPFNYMYSKEEFW